MAEQATHDCFGVILRSGGGVFTLVSGQTGKVYASLNKDGLKVIKGSGKRREENTIPLKALKVLIREAEKVQE